MPFAATVLTMFPEAFPGPLGVSLIGTAWREQGLWSLETVDIRGFSSSKRGFLDDTPAGGGAGQVMRADVVASALDSVERGLRPLLYMSARGRPLTQARVLDWAAGSGLIVLCGRFEGVDQRVLDARGFDDWALKVFGEPHAVIRQWCKSRMLEHRSFTCLVKSCYLIVDYHKVQFIASVVVVIVLVGGTSEVFSFDDVV